MNREQKVSLIWFACTMTIVPLYVLIFSKYRIVSTSLPIPTYSRISTHDTSMWLNVTLNAITCTRICGIGSLCEQGNFGIVRKCLRCPLGEIPMGARCRPPKSKCTNAPWCSRDEAMVVSDLHKALDAANGTQTKIGLELSPFYATLVRIFDSDSNEVAAQSLFLINELVVAQHNSTFDPTRWFNDEHGWWSSSMSAYEYEVPNEWVPYTTHIKKRMCMRTWVAKKDNTCQPPTYVVL